MDGCESVAGSLHWASELLALDIQKLDQVRLVV